MGAKRKIRKILVVDDDRTITALLKKYLEKNGYEVIAINEASEGLELAMTRKPDLIVLDVMMPIINGFNFCRLVKAEEDTKDIPIILLTSRNKMKDIEIGLEMGAEAYLIKPLNIEELIRTIKIIESAEK
ncbi:MAG: response regulator [Candidatus Omnitrophica bacterium]|nr:response regulator [Candidatus Omnitrophota bacterium]